MVINYIAHHGVKGMKWGVRKQYEVLGTRNRKSNSAESSKKKTLSGKKKAALIIGGSLLAAAAITTAIVIARKNKGKKAVSSLLDQDLAKKAKYIHDLETNSFESIERWSKDYFADGRYIERFPDGTVVEGLWK